MRITIGRRSMPVVTVAIAAALLPLMAAALYVGIVRLANRDRFDPAYFTPELNVKYSTPGHVANALAGALQANDQAVLARLEGLRQPVAFPTGGERSMALLRPIAKSTYYMAMITDDKAKSYRIYRLGPAQGRWVVSPDDDYTLVDSGLWLAAWLPPALIWWVVEAASLIVLGVNTLLKRGRPDQTRLHDAS